MAREMKESGVEWIGEIPRKWKVKRLKSCISNRTAGNWGEDEKNDENDFICIRVADFDYERMGIKKTNNYTKRNYSESIVKKLLLKENDILIEKSGGGEKTPVGRTIIFKETFPALYANFIERLRVNFNIINPMFLQYLFVTFYRNKYILNYIKQTTGIQNLDITSMLTNEKVVLPSLEEQEKIANYLDKKVSDIDLIIEKTKATIEDYKKYKQSIITEAVTKGLNPDVEMKDSGIEWIGEIPKHWEVKRLRFLGNCQNGISKSAEYFGQGFPFISYGDVYKNFILPENPLSLVQSTEKDREIYSIKYGDVFFTRTSETIEEIGFTSTCLKTIKNGVFAGFVIRFRPTNLEELSPDFSKYYFRSNIHRKFFVKEMNLVTRASLSQELLKKLPILLPPQEEQKQIANYLNKKTSEIDTLITKKEELIRELEEYKKSLIYECVTGKKEVIVNV